MDKVRQKGFLGEKITFSCFLAIERKKGEKKENSKLLSLIYGVLSIGIRQAKSESSSTQRGLHAGTKKVGFHRRSKGGDFGKSNFQDKEVFLRPPTVLLHSKR